MELWPRVLATSLKDGARLRSTLRRECIVIYN
jgi:hypothetical protein